MATTKKATELVITAKLSIDLTNPAVKQYVTQGDYVNDELAELTELANTHIPKRKPVSLKTKAGSKIKITYTKK